MNAIKFISRLSPYYDEETLNRLLANAEKNSVHNNLVFKVTDVKHLSGTDGRTIRIQSEQVKSRDGELLTKEEITAITRSMFSRQFFPKVIIEVDPIVFSGINIAQVDADWVALKLRRAQITIKNMVDDTGIDKSNLSAWVTGTRPMSQPVKALMYYYFKNIDQERNEFSESEIEDLRSIVHQLEFAALPSFKKMIRHRLRSEYGFFISEFKEHGEPFVSADFENLITKGVIKVKPSN